MTCLNLIIGENVKEECVAWQHCSSSCTLRKLLADKKLKSELFYFITSQTSINTFSSNAKNTIKHQMHYFFFWDVHISEVPTDT